MLNLPADINDRIRSSKSALEVAVAIVFQRFPNGILNPLASSRTQRKNRPSERRRHGNEKQNLAGRKDEHSLGYSSESDAKYSGAKGQAPIRPEHSEQK